MRLSIPLFSLLAVGCQSQYTPADLERVKQEINDSFRAQGWLVSEIALVRQDGRHATGHVRLVDPDDRTNTRALNCSAAIEGGDSRLAWRCDPAGQVERQVPPTPPSPAARAEPEGFTPAVLELVRQEIRRHYQGRGFPVLDVHLIREEARRAVGFVRTANANSPGGFDDLACNAIMEEGSEQWTWYCR